MPALLRRILGWLEILISVGVVLGLMTVAIVSGGSGFGALALLAGMGLLGLWLVAFAHHLRYRDQDRTIMIGGAGLVPLCILIPLMGWAVPRLRVVASVAGPPTVLTVDQLLAAPPDLPRYVRLSGTLEPDLALDGAYTRRVKGGTTTTEYCRTPLVQRGWEPGAAVPVITSACLNEFKGGTIAGILYAIPPAPGAVPMPGFLLDDGGDIPLDAAPFRYDPGAVYFLDARTPGGLLLATLGPPIGLALFIGGLLWLAGRAERKKRGAG